MEKLIVKGKKNLSGTIPISGSKNASLPILAASILTNKVLIKNIPLVRDISTMIDLLRFIGMECKLEKKKNLVKIKNTKKKINPVAPYKLMKTMRAGVLVLGPLLAKYKKAKISLPGGCAIGTRPVNLHLFALKRLGAKIKIKNGYIFASAENGLKGSVIRFTKISVGATESAILSALLAKGKTTLLNCAIEPEVLDLINFLNKIGGKINIFNRKITINGISEIKNKEFSHKVMFDRIELGTYIIAGALSGKKLVITNVNPKIIKTELKIFKKMGIKFIISRNKIIILSSKKINRISIHTEPYPGFPTDLQAQIMVLMTRAKGISKIRENIFENRFMHVPELRRMGAKIEIKNNTASVYGQSDLSGAEVMATDLRASVSLVLAGLIASGQTIINRIYHLDRGYFNLEKKLKKCKAVINRI
tara:strand:- start:2029 stop:3288 length:1260 start_codon:yes stop_codon:yes gene_type:complete